MSQEQRCFFYVTGAEVWCDLLSIILSYLHHSSLKPPLIPCWSWLSKYQLHAVIISKIPRDGSCSSSWYWLAGCFRGSSDYLLCQSPSPPFMENPERRLNRCEHYCAQSIYLHLNLEVNPATQFLYNQLLGNVKAPDTLEMASNCLFEAPEHSSVMVAASRCLLIWRRWQSNGMLLLSNCLFINTQMRLTISIGTLCW